MHSTRAARSLSKPGHIWIPSTQFSRACPFFREMDLRRPRQPHSRWRPNKWPASCGSGMKSRPGLLLTIDNGFGGFAGEPGPMDLARIIGVPPFGLRWHDTALARRHVAARNTPRLCTSRPTHCPHGEYALIPADSSLAYSREARRTWKRRCTLFHANA